MVSKTSSVAVKEDLAEEDVEDEGGLCNWTSSANEICFVLDADLVAKDDIRGGGFDNMMLLYFLSTVSTEDEGPNVGDVCAIVDILLEEVELLLC